MSYAVRWYMRSTLDDPKYFSATKHVIHKAPELKNRVSIT